MSKRARRKYIEAISKQVNRKKMYKAKKQWIVAGVSLLIATGLPTAVSGNLTTNVSASHTHARSARVVHVHHHKNKRSHRHLSKKARARRIKRIKRARARKARRMRRARMRKDRIRRRAKNLHRRMMKNDAKRHFSRSYRTHRHAKRHLAKVSHHIRRNHKRRVTKKHARVDHHRIRAVRRPTKGRKVVINKKQLNKKKKVVNSISKHLKKNHIKFADHLPLPQETKAQSALSTKNPSYSFSEKNATSSVQSDANNAFSGRYITSSDDGMIYKYFYKNKAVEFVKPSSPSPINTNFKDIINNSDFKTGTEDDQGHNSNSNIKYVKFDSDIASNLGNSSISMNRMFENDTNLRSVVFGKDTLKTGSSAYISDTQHMFTNDWNLQNVVMPSYSNNNTYGPFDTAYMFNNDINLQNINLGSINTQYDRDMAKMFYNDNSLTSIKPLTFNTTAVNSSQINNDSDAGMQSMFQGDQSLTNLNLSSFNTGAIKMNNMFASDNNLQKITFGNGFNTQGYEMDGSNRNNYDNNMFNNDGSLTEIDTPNSSTTNSTKFTSDANLPSTQWYQSAGSTKRTANMYNNNLKGNYTRTPDTITFAFCSVRSDGSTDTSNIIKRVTQPVYPGELVDVTKLVPSGSQLNNASDEPNEYNTYQVPSTGNLAGGTNGGFINAHKNGNTISIPIEASSVSSDINSDGNQSDNNKKNNTNPNSDGTHTNSDSDNGSGTNSDNQTSDVNDLGVGHSSKVNGNTVRRVSTKGHFKYIRFARRTWAYSNVTLPKDSHCGDLYPDSALPAVRIQKIFKVTYGRTGQTYTRYELNIDGTNYFVTASPSKTPNAYYQQSDIPSDGAYVKARKHISTYRTKNGGHIHYYSPGHVFHVSKVVNFGSAGNKQTRFRIAGNGHYITANANYVRLEDND